MPQKLGPISLKLIEQGFVKGTEEFRKAYGREKWHRRSKKSKKSGWKRTHEKERQKCKEDPEFLNKIRERWRLSKQKQRKLRGEQINEQQRKCYRAAGDKRKKAIYAARNRRNPHRGLASLIKAVRAGRIEPRVLIDRTSAAIEQCSALIHRGPRKSVSK